MRYPNETRQTQFRLRAETLGELDYIAECLRAERGGKATRADAVRYAVSETARCLRAKEQKGK